MVDISGVYGKLKTWVHTQIAAHKANASAHHSKYLDSEAVASVLADDAYVKNTGDRITGDFEMWAHFKTDKYLASDYNLFLGIGVCGDGNLAHSSGNQGWYNVGIGYQALYSNTTGEHNSCFGKKALYKNTTGVRNLALGVEAMYSNISGNWNIGIGYSALYYSTIGNYNIGIGYRALIANISGNENLGIGKDALYKNTSGYSNLAICGATLYENTTGYRNIAIGSAALYYNTTGAGNVAIGYYAGMGTTPGAKTNDIFIGNRAGQNENGSNKLYIHNSASASPLIYGEFDNTILKINGYLYITSIKSGTTQANAGAAANEVWKTNGHASLPDNVLMIGI